MRTQQQMQIPGLYRTNAGSSPRKVTMKCVHQTFKRGYRVLIDVNYSVAQVDFQFWSIFGYAKPQRHTFQSGCPCQPAANRTNLTILSANNKQE